MPDLDLEKIMQMAQNAQAELQKAQDNLDHVEVEGASGGGLVKIQASAKGRIIAEFEKNTPILWGQICRRGL